MVSNPRVRFQINEIFPQAKGDFVVRVAMLSREIENNGIVHPMYGMGFYALVEQLFIQMQTEKLKDLSTFIFNLNKPQNNLLPLEQFWLFITQQWLESIIAVCLGQQSPPLSEDQFKDAYCTLFYASVFRKYDDEKCYGKPFQSNDSSVAIYYLEDSLPLVSSFIFIRNQMEKTLANNMTQIPQNDEQNASLLLGIESEPENVEYLKSIDKDRIASITSLLSVGLRIYREIDGEVSVLAKYNQPAASSSVNISLGFVFCGLHDNFRIGYDSTLEQQYLMFSHYQRKINSLQMELQRGISIIHESNAQRRAALEQKLLQHNSTIENNLQILQQTKDVFQQEQNNFNEAEVEFQQQQLKCQELEKIMKQLQKEIEKKSQQKDTKVKDFNQTQTQALEIKLMIEKKNEILQRRQEEVKERFLQDKKLAEQGNQTKMDKGFDAMNQSKVIHRSFNHANNGMDIGATMSANPRKQDCDLCAEEKFKTDFIIMECCGFCACSDCIKKTFLNVNQDNALKCLGCQKPLRELASLSNHGLLPDQILSKFMKKAFLTCPQCQSNFSIKSDLKSDTKKSDIIITPCCDVEMCKNCQSYKHQKGDICKERIINCELLIQSQIAVVNEMIKDLKDKNPKNLDATQMENELKELEKEKRFRFCPDCEVLLIKDAHCEHLPCPSCKLQLCFTCAAPRDPSVAHSLACYHREGCKYYEPEPPLAPRKFIENCSYCVAKGSLCDLPSSWVEYQDLVKTWYGERFFAQEFEYNWIQDKPIFE